MQCFSVTFGFLLGTGQMQEGIVPLSSHDVQLLAKILHLLLTMLTERGGGGGGGGGGVEEVRREEGKGESGGEGVEGRRRRRGREEEERVENTHAKKVVLP